MEAENEEIIIINDEEGLKDHGEEASAKSYRENEALEEENEEENSDQSSESSDSVEEVFQVVPRTFISKSYMEAKGGLKEKHFSTHKKLSMPSNAQTKSGGFDAFFAATLHMDDDDDILIEHGDSFNEFIFLVCLKVDKADDLLFVFINSAWLDKCPEESEGYDAMLACTKGKTLLIVFYY